MPKAPATVPAASRAEWKPSAQAALVAALHKEKVEGRMVENGFKPVSWTYVSAAVLEKAQIGVNAKQCKNHWAMLRARYKDLVRMRQLSGLGWNEEACQLTATADVWDAYLQLRVELDVYSWRSSSFDRQSWATVLSEETTLTPAQIASVCKIWRNKPELAEEYSSFPPEHREARTIWLHSELQELERN
ncbi:Myb/SANT-like DNA-binding domain-containing protein [Cytidiella melzeri]|nr:Myb/SANT-like DNA-binding domain-containing protein [Cytidiella melzeri]